jgi:hypothetical protein
VIYDEFVTGCGPKQQPVYQVHTYTATACLSSPYLHSHSLFIKSTQPHPHNYSLFIKSTQPHPPQLQPVYQIRTLTATSCFIRFGDDIISPSTQVFPCCFFRFVLHAESLRAFTTYLIHSIFAANPTLLERKSRELPKFLLDIAVSNCC